MTEKQGAAEWLRGIIDEYRANGAQSCSAMARMFGIDCKYETCRGCMTRMMAAIADRIDAERALPEGVEWPRFEDGEMVKFGDEVEFEGEAAKVLDVAFSVVRFSLGVGTATTSGRVYCDLGESVNRFTPKVLDADGVPIKVGDTVYCDDDPEQLIVDSFDGPGCVFLTLAKNPSGMLYTIEPSRLTHERPDSWERLEEDAAKCVCEYAGAEKRNDSENAYTCISCPYDKSDPHATVECNERMRLDLVRRAKALAKAGEVE